MQFIPFNRPYQQGKELQHIQQAMESWHISGDGQFTKECSQLLETEIGVPKALLTTSCTHALEMSAILLDIQPGDEVIVPSFTFVSSINAFVLRGAVPIFADIRSDTLNIDETKIEPLISSRTRAIVVVHYAGVGCEMDEIMKIAAKHNLSVIEDNAHGLFGKYKGQMLGTFGKMAAQSFHETKNISCGEGGALLINDAEYIERAEIIREKGTNRSRFFRGEVDKYTWVDVGSSYLPSEILAAYLYAQLSAWREIQAMREKIWQRYEKALAPWAEENAVSLPSVPAYCEQSFHMFYLLLPSLDDRQGLIDHLRASNIYAVFHYQPLHLSKMGLEFNGKPGDCPLSEAMSDRLLRLPFYNDMTTEEQDQVIKVVTEFQTYPHGGEG